MKSRREKEKSRKRMTNARKWAEEQDKGYEATTFKLPEGIERYELKPGTHQVDFIPFLAGKGNPRADEGFPHFEREYTVHRIPTANGRQLFLCCLYDCFGKKCPCCQWVNEKGGTADKELVRQMRGRKQHLWLINDKPGDFKNKLKVLDTIHFNRERGFGEMFADAIQMKESYADFAELEGGYTVEMRVKESTLPSGRKYPEVSRFDFIKRDYDYPEDYIEKKAVCLDDLLIEPDPKKMIAAINQGAEDMDEDDEEEEDRRPSSRRDRDEEKDEEEEDDEEEDEEEEEEEPADFNKGDYVTYDGEECEILRVLSSGKLDLEDEDGKKYKAVDPDDCEKVKTQDDEDEEEDEDSDSEDEDEDKEEV